MMREAMATKQKRNISFNAEFFPLKKTNLMLRKKFIPDTIINEREFARIRSSPNSLQNNFKNIIPNKKDIIPTVKNTPYCLFKDLIFSSSLKNVL